MSKAEARQRAEMFFCSVADNSWWKKYKDDRPNKLIGHYENLPNYVQKLRFKYGEWR